MFVRAKSTFCIMYHKVLKEFSQNIRDGQFDAYLAGFNETEDSVEKLLIIDELERNGSFQRPEIQPRIAKNNGKSKVYRTLGNDEFKYQTNAGHLAALKQYNKSICYAENGSEELGLGFSNRSAVYFELGLYDDCIDNIQLARQTVPKRLMEKLNNREAECLKRKGVANKNPEPKISPKLSFPANAQIPFIANCLKLEKNEQFGRHIKTTVDLKPGDVVAIEDAFCSALDHRFRYMRCEKCLKENNYNLMPCQHCVTVMFCRTCRDEASETFHKIECPVIDLMAQLLCDYAFVTLRKVICTITSFRSADALIAFIEETRDQNLTIFDCDYTEKSSHYAPVHFIVGNVGNVGRDIGAALGAYILTSLVLKPLFQLTELKDMFTDEQAVSVLGPLILHHMQRSQKYYAGSVSFNGSLFFEYAKGVHPFRGLLNHSCAPNLSVTSTNSKFVYTVLKPTKAGEQLFDNYK